MFQINEKVSEYLNNTNRLLKFSSNKLGNNNNMSSHFNFMIVYLSASDKPGMKEAAGKGASK